MILFCSLKRYLKKKKGVYNQMHYVKKVRMIYLIFLSIAVFLGLFYIIKDSKNLTSTAAKNHPTRFFLATPNPTTTEPTPQAISEVQVETVSTSIKKKVKKYKSLTKFKEDMNFDMDLSKPSGLSKKDFIKLLSGLKSKLLKKHPLIPPDPNGVYKKEASFIWKLGQKYQVNEIFLTALTGQEGAWCGDSSAIKCNNFTGQKPSGELVYYKSVRKGLEKTAKNLRKRYLKKGRKNLSTIQSLYCPNSTTWDIEVYKCMKTIVY